jgi:hypothetical protein
MVTRLVRRIHMYLALFLAPWMLMYAASTVIMNHGRTASPAFELEWVQAYSAVFPDGTPPTRIADQILRDLGLEGAHGVQ